jgi:RsiW-degrading membrane proteinase PrsW (M82 family)
VLAVVVQVLVGDPSQALKPLGVSSVVVSAVIVAPVVEEATKALGLRWVEDLHVELEDGLIYGAAAGLGFSATENLLYGVSALLDGGVGAFVATIAIRTVSSSLLHATASALLGYAVWKRRAGRGSILTILGFYALAALVHAAFNFAATIQLVGTLIASIAFAMLGFGLVRRRVRKLDTR